MHRLPTALLATAVLTVACTDNLGPLRPEGRHVQNQAAAATTIAFDQQVGVMGERDTTVLAKGFNGGDPQTGDAVVATIFWSGTNTLLSVTDFHTDVNRTPLNNTYHQVGPIVTAGNISMATFVATNIQGFVPNQDPSVVYAVQATFSQKVSDGGMLLTAFSGVAPLFTDAMGASSSASGAMGANGTVSDPGAIAVDVGQVAYGVTLSNGVVGHVPPPNPPWVRTNAGVLGDGMLFGEGNYTFPPFSTAGTADPQWNWGSPPAAGSTWLASFLALKPAGGTSSPPVASFTSSCSALTCTFTSTSTAPSGTITGYSWTFGDGATSTAQNPSHTYSAGGTYTVTLTVTDNNGATNATSQSVTVAANQPPVASFTKSCSGLTCNFTSTSTAPSGTITGYSWTFGDGATSTAQNPSHTYGAGGTYTVTLTVTDNNGATNATSQSVTVAANQPPVASFTKSCSGLTCNFTSTSTAPSGTITGYSWTFGDGATSTAQNPSHTYGAGGTYTVTLT